MSRGVREVLPQLRLRVCEQWPRWRGSSSSG